MQRRDKARPLRVGALAIWSSRGAAGGVAAAGGRPARPGRGSHVASRRLVPALAALALSLVLALGAVAAASAAGALAGAPPVAGGSVMGILLDGSPDPDEDRQGGDSRLGVLLALDGRVPEVTFVSQGVEVSRVSVPWGTAIPDPGRPRWAWSGEGAGFTTHGFAEGVHVPAFAGWCMRTDDAGNGAGAAFAFDEPATELTYTFYAAWEDAADDATDLLRVTLDMRGGELARVRDPVTDAWLEATAESGAPAIDRRVGEPWRWLPAPTLAGHAFLGWSTVESDAAGAALVDAEALVARGSGDARETALYAQWAPVTYTIVYIDRPDGRGSKVEQLVTYGTLPSLWTWDEAAGENRLSRPAGKRFAGWADACDYDGENGQWYAGGHKLTADLADAAGARVALYAQWEDEELAESYEVRLHHNDGADDAEGTVVTLDVPTGTALKDAEGYEAPKRAGWQFAGWHDDESLSEGSAWDPSRQVLGELDLWAAWTLRLDVTVPVSVGFAVDAETGAALGPDAGAYALKSRTVAPVEVTELALESEQAELDVFFELAEGDTGTPDGWKAALMGTALSARAQGADAIELPFADADAGGAGGTWAHARPLRPAERVAWRMPAFSYGSLAADDAWAGADPSQRLALELGLGVSDRLKVRTGQPGAVPITHLKVTVTAVA